MKIVRRLFRVVLQFLFPQVAGENIFAFLTIVSLAAISVTPSVLWSIVQVITGHDGSLQTLLGVERLHELSLVLLVVGTLYLAIYAIARVLIRKDVSHINPELFRNTSRESSSNRYFAHYSFMIILWLLERLLTAQDPAAALRLSDNIFLVFGYMMVALILFWIVYAVGGWVDTYRSRQEGVSRDSLSVSQAHRVGVITAVIFVGLAIVYEVGSVLFTTYAIATFVVAVYSNAIDESEKKQ
jgi:hypothetical protein